MFNVVVYGPNSYDHFVMSVEKTAVALAYAAELHPNAVVEIGFDGELHTFDKNGGLLIRPCTSRKANFVPTSLLQVH